MAATCRDEGKDHIYGFFDPQMIQQIGNKSTESQTYITDCLLSGDKRIYFAPYIHE